MRGKWISRNHFRMRDVRFSQGPRFMADPFVQDLDNTRICGRHPISLMKIRGVPKSWLEVTHCPA